MIVTNVKQEWIDLVPEFDKIEQCINDSLPVQLQGNKNIIANSMYCLLDKDNNKEVHREKRRQLLDYLFSNYRINGVLDVYSSDLLNEDKLPTVYDAYEYLNRR